MASFEDPDRAFERRQADENERYEAERRADRLADYTPQPPHGRAARRPQPPPSPRITSAMVMLAHTVLNGADHDRRDACRALAELVLEAL